MMQTLKNLIQKAGVVGAGGAGFPTHVKLADNIETILINGTECEPLLKTDFYLLCEERERLESTLATLVEKTGAKNGVIGIKKHTAELLGMKEEITHGNISYRFTGDIYPSGDEVVLIQETLGKTVPAGRLPISVGVVVMNVETLYNVANALEETPVTHKYLTVGGKTDKTYVMKVPVGTPVSHIFESLKIEVPQNCTVLDGGPMMGSIVNPKTAIVTKTTKSLLIVDDHTLCIRLKTRSLADALNRSSGNCCGCRMCTDMCPRYLMGYPIEPHKIVQRLSAKATDTKTFMGAFYCSNCGVCQTIACPQNISPNRLFARVKAELLKNGVKPVMAEESKPVKERVYRRVPSKRLVNRLGVLKYYRDEYEFVTIPEPKQVTLPLKMHIGAPGEAIVKAGDSVTVGQLIIKPKENALGANIHSSVNGTVFSVSESSIVITVS
ncbi:MAG: 4Fe-4S dicluster domain-containing protein [Clostridia bacterium]|nr:4Fe-4S dicluster domain-containing protein [Clostridia bacterium]